MFQLIIMITMDNQYKIAAVIPVYNGRKYLPDCLDSLQNQTLLLDQIIIVDNASTDGSREFLDSLKVKDSKFKIILNQKNLGFAAACNQGIIEALNGKVDYIFLLNQDTVCEKDCLEKLLETAEKQDNFFALQPLILLWDNKNLIQTSGDCMHFLGFGYSGQYKSEIRNTRFETKEITYASGAAMFINARALKAVG